MNQTPILAFIGTAYAYSVALSLAIGLTGGQQSPYIAFAFASMFLPAVSVVVVRSFTNDGPLLQWDRLPWRFLPVALLLMPVVLHAAMLPALAATPGALVWQDWLTPQADGLFHTPASRGWGVLSLGGLAWRIALNAIVGLLVVSVLAFFEEIGWRAWLLPRLVARMGGRRAVIVTAVIWAIWHVPFQLSGVQSIERVSPMALALFAPVGILAAGLIIGWLWLRTESIWLVSLAHGALNNWGQYAFKFMKDPAGPGVSEQVTADIQALGVGFVALLTVGVVLVWAATPSTSLEERAR